MKRMINVIENLTKRVKYKLKNSILFIVNIQYLIYVSIVLCVSINNTIYIATFNYY